MPIQNVSTHTHKEKWLKTHNIWKQKEEALKNQVN